MGRRSLVAKRHIPKGVKITKSMLTVKKPGDGIHSQFMDIIIGRIARVNIAEDEIITWEMI